jgi:hypothetical protein
MKSLSVSALLTSGIVLAVSMLSGCQSTGLSTLKRAVPSSVVSFFGGDKPVRWSDNENPVVRCVCLWQSADGTWEGRPTRGFGGQVFFLDRNTAKPIAVKGDVRIHVFDNFGPRENHGKAVHTFDFNKGAWNNFLVKTQFGPAYNIFIPYTRKGYHKTECALRVRLVETDTHTVFSDMSYVELGGAENTATSQAESLAVNSPDRQDGLAHPADSIGQISKQNGVTRTSANRPLNKQPAEAKPRSPTLSPELEARLAEFQKTNPVKLHNKDTKSQIPRKLEVPASVSPILGPSNRPSVEAIDDEIDDRSNTSTRHALSPAHPLDVTGTSRTAPQVKVAANPIEESKAVVQESDGGLSESHERMMSRAELAAAKQDWPLAIRLASTVDRAVRTEHVTWPLNRPTPSALVARWEVQRIDMTTSGDPILRTARIDSRVEDYLKASQLRADKDQPSEARRLATVAHLVSRAAMIEADGVESSAAGVDGGEVIRAGGIDATESARIGVVPAAGWNESPSKPDQSAEPAQPKRQAHPLEVLGGVE